jgi:hypothetical protein
MADFDWDKDSVPVRDEGAPFDWEKDSVDEKEWVAKKASMPGPLQFAVDQFARGVTEEWSDEIGGAVGGATSDRVGQRTKDLMRD